MQFFQEFDYENETNSSKKLNIIEKGVVIAFVVLCKIILYKLKKAQTYGDIYKVINFVGNKLGMIDEKYSNEDSELTGDQIIKDMVNIGNDADKL